jgi:hypothetical protein
MTLAPKTGKVSWDSMGLRRVLFLAEVLLASVEVPGIFIRLESHRAQDPWSIADRLGTCRLPDRAGWRLSRSRQPASGSLELEPLEIWARAPLVCEPQRSVPSAPDPRSSMATAVVAFPKMHVAHDEGGVAEPSRMGLHNRSHYAGQLPP